MSDRASVLYGPKDQQHGTEEMMVEYPILPRMPRYAEMTTARRLMFDPETHTQSHNAFLVIHVPE